MNKNNLLAVLEEKDQLELHAEPWRMAKGVYLTGQLQLALPPPRHRNRINRPSHGAFSSGAFQQLPVGEYGKHHRSLPEGLPTKPRNMKWPQHIQPSEDATEGSPISQKPSLGFHAGARGPDVSLYETRSNSTDS
jgi:hypothetical protein